MPSDRGINELVNYFLDGVQWAFRSDYNELSTHGRSLSNRNGTKGTQKWLNLVVVYLLTHQADKIIRLGELQALQRERLMADEGDFSGNRYFWHSDFASHNRPGYHLGIKTSSTRTIATECSTGQNLLGYYMAMGNTLIMQRGDEYVNVIPFWDWNKLPGITAPLGALKRLDQNIGWDFKGNTTFVGGVSDGMYGCNNLDYQRDNMKAKKSWFMFDEGYLALGAGITGKTDFPIYTSVNQCTLFGDVVVSADGKTQTLEKGSRYVDNVSWVLQDNIGYVFTGDEKVEIKNQTETGSWATCNSNNPKDEVSGDVFLLGINHGVHPQDAKYQYLALMNSTQESVEKYVEEMPIQVLENSANTQAVWHNKLKMLQVVFWKKGSITTPEGVVVSVDKACMLMMEPTKNGFKIIVSDPNHKKQTVKVTLSGTMKDNIEFKLLDYQDWGKSVAYDSEIGFLTSNPNQRDIKPLAEVASLVGITLDGMPLAGFSSGILEYVYTISDDKSAPIVKAFGKFNNTIVNKEDRIDIEVEDENNPINKIIYTIHLEYKK
jgi:chondroitin AC lyase